LTVEEIVARAIDAELARQDGGMSCIREDLTVEWIDQNEVDLGAAARAALRALEEAGWAVVPRAMTPEIADAGPVEPYMAQHVWERMLDAARRDEGKSDGSADAS